NSSLQKSVKPGFIDRNNLVYRRQIPNMTDKPVVSVDKPVLSMAKGEFTVRSICFITCQELYIKFIYQLIKHVYPFINQV
ncbi:hypothetical protein, partial [Salmonella sp. s51884]|uniref:hypothetical protein n=1 Tax=Salmonella sp. s51884 TaxID=3159654 RepID=UPI00397F4CAC